jgi:hypothetical protein
MTLYNGPDSPGGGHGGRLWRRSSRCRSVLRLPAACRGEGPNRPPFTIGQVNLVAFVAGGRDDADHHAARACKLAHAMDPKPLKRIFAVFIMIMALNMLRKALGW